MTLRFPRRCNFALIGVGFALWTPSPAGAAPTPIVGKITSLSGSSFTVQTLGRRIGVVSALQRAAGRINGQDYPYVYGGGHEQAGIASVGIPGPGFNGHRKGYDCSGAVGAVLAGAGLWAPYSGVPADNGIISQLSSEGVIARGVGAGPVEVTLYDDWGVHIFMNINGRFFGTSDGGGGANSRGGAGWLDDGAPDASSRRYRAYHFVRSVLKQSTTTGQVFAFETGDLDSTLVQFHVGEPVKVIYQQQRSGALLARTVSYPGARNLSGTVIGLSDDGKSLAVQTASGKSVTISLAQLDGDTTAALSPGDQVQVSYTVSHGSLIARTLLSSGTGTGSWPGSWTPPQSWFSGRR